MGSRAETRTAETVTLLAIYKDGTGDLVDPDVAPVVYIYDSSVTDAVREAEATAATYTSAIAGPLTATQHGTGFYGITYTVPSGSTNGGSWFDIWVSTIDGVSAYNEQTFSVILPAEVLVFSQNLAVNQLVVLQLDSTIADTTGVTLGSDQVLYFLTELNPYYASVNMVRSCVGPALDYIDDITLAIIIHQSSIKADFLKPTSTKYSTRLNQALTCWTVCDASLKAISLARQTADGVSSTGEGTKSLGSFSIETTSSSSSGVAAHIARLVEKLEDCLDEWTPVVQSGGYLAPGQSFPEQVAVRGIYHGDRRSGGREWVDPLYVTYKQPVLNDKSFFFGTNKQYQHNSASRNGLGVDYLVEDDD